jgi:hypothetical protein
MWYASPFSINYLGEVVIALFYTNSSLNNGYVKGLKVIDRTN